MSTNVIAFPNPESHDPAKVRPWSLATALRRLGFVRIEPVRWPDGACAFGLGRFVAVRPDVPTPTHTILTEVARLLAGPERAWPYTAEADSQIPATGRAELVADCVRILAEGRAPASALRARLLEHDPVERERIARLARRIHEAGLGVARPATVTLLRAAKSVASGKPGHRRMRLRA